MFKFYIVCTKLQQLVRAKCCWNQATQKQELLKQMIIPKMFGNCCIRISRVSHYLAINRLVGLAVSICRVIIQAYGNLHSAPNRIEFFFFLNCLFS